MRKYIFSTIAILFLVILSACNRKTDVLRVGMDLKYPPFETVDNNEAIGISVDIAKALGEYLGMEVEIVNTNFPSLIPALQSKEIDIIISSMSITEERSKVVDFSKAYMSFNIISLVNKEFASRNGITEESTKEDLLNVNGVKFVGLASQVSTQIPESYDKDVKQVTELSTAIAEVVQGTSDILLMSANPVAEARNKNPEDTIVVWDSFVPSPIGVAVRKGNTELLNKINAFVDSMNDEGGLYDVLRDKYDDEIRNILGGRGFDFYIEK